MKDFTKVAALIKFASLSPAEQEAQPSISTTALVHDALPELIFMLELVETILEKVAE